jgi:hypothetical protein
MDNITRQPLWSGTVRWVVFVLALCAPAQAAPPLDPREVLLQAQLDTLESLVRRLDGARASGTNYTARVWDLHRRVTVLEKTYGLRGGIVSQRADLATLLLDAGNLGARVRAVWLAKAMAAAPEKDVPDQGLFEMKPPDPSATAPAAPAPPTGPSAGKGIVWPTSLSFKATAKLHYRHVGEWLLGPKHYTGWGPDFLQTGYSGEISISVRARNLVREVRSADLRVVARVLAPFVTQGGGFRVVDLTWTSERALNNSALKTWMGVDRLSIPGPYRWIKGPDDLSAPVDVEAHVRSVTLQDGTVFHFLAPEYVLRR